MGAGGLQVEAYTNHSFCCDFSNAVRGRVHDRKKKCVVPEVQE